MANNEIRQDIDSVLGEQPTTPVEPGQDVVEDVDAAMSMEASTQYSPDMEDYDFVTKMAGDILTPGTEGFEGVISQINNKLKEQGWSSEDIAKANFPMGVPGMEIGMLTDDQYRQLRATAFPIIVENQQVLFDQADVADQMLKETGQDKLSPYDWSALRQYIGQWQDRAGNAMGRGRRQWSRFQREMSEQAVELTRDPAIELDAGLLALDGARWLDAKWKLNMVSESKKDDITARTLRPIKFTDPTRPDEEPQEFSNGFTASLHVLRRSAALRAEQFKGFAIRGVGGILRELPGDSIRQLGMSLQGSGQVKVEDALAGLQALEGRVYQSVAMAGEPLEWYQVLESYVPDEGVEAWYEEQARAGLAGDLRLAAYASGSALAEIAIDPLLVIGPVAKGAIQAGRVVGRRLAPAQALKIAEQVAKRTYQLEDAVEFQKAAERNFSRVHAEFLNDNNMDNARRLQTAWEQRHDAQKFVDRFQDAGENEGMLVRQAKRDPATIDPQTIKPYIDVAAVDRMEYMRKFYPNNSEVQAQGSLEDLAQWLADRRFEESDVLDNFPGLQEVNKKVRAVDKQIARAKSTADGLDRLPLKNEEAARLRAEESQAIRENIKKLEAQKTNLWLKAIQEQSSELKKFAETDPVVNRALEILGDAPTFTTRPGAIKIPKFPKDKKASATPLLLSKDSPELKGLSDDIARLFINNKRPEQLYEGIPAAEAFKRKVDMRLDRLKRARGSVKEARLKNRKMLDEAAKRPRTPKENVGAEGGAKGTKKGAGKQGGDIRDRLIPINQASTRMTRDAHDEIADMAIDFIRDNYDALEEMAARSPRVRYFLENVKPDGPRVKTVDELAAELHHMRKAQIERNAVEPIEWDKYDDLPLWQQRQVLGPDDTEQAAGGLEHMVKTGGTGVDDIATTTKLNNPMPEYDINAGRGNKDAFIDWRAIDRNNEITKLEREWLDSGAGRQLSLLESETDTVKKATITAARLRKRLSAQRMAIRQASGANDRMGKLRNTSPGLGKSIQYYRNEAARLRKLEEELSKKSDSWWDQVTDDTFWLPGESTPLLKDENRLSKWLSASGERAHRSLYPGGVMLNMLEFIGGAEDFVEQMGPAGKKMAQGSRAMREGVRHGFNLWREPHRFFGHYNPRAWQAIRAGVENFQQQSIRDFDRFTHLAERAGIISEKGKLSEMAGTGFAVNKQASERVFNVLDVNRTADKVVKSKTDQGKPLYWMDGDGNYMNGQDVYNMLFDDLPAKEQEFVEKTREWLDHMADQLGISDTSRYITGYIHHVWRDKDFANGARPLEFIGAPAKHQTWVAHLLNRTGEEGFEKDVILALDTYIRGTNRKLYMEPVYKQIMDTTKELAQQYGRPGMITYGNSLVAEMKGQPTFLGTRVDEMIGTFWPGGANMNALDRGLTGLTALWWAGALPGNPRYPVMQVATAVATTTGRFGLYRTLKGFFMQGTVEGRAMSKAAGVEQQIQQVFESDAFRKLSKLASELPITISPLGITSTQGVENRIRGMTWWAAFDMHMTKMGFASVQEAAEAGFLNRIAFEALRSSEEVNHVFGAGGRSPYLTRLSSRGVAATATQFLSFVPKQLEELASQANRNPGAIMDYMGISGYISLLAAEEAGIDLTDYVGLGFIPNEPRELQSPAVKALILSAEWMSAWSAWDKETMAQKGQELIAQMEAIVPLSANLRTARRTAERLMTGEVLSSRGHKERDLDFKDVVQGIGDIPGAIDPNAQQALPAMGGDLLPTLTGMMSIQDRLHFLGRKEIRKVQQDTVYDLRRRVRRAVDALEDGDRKGFQEQFTAIANDHRLGNASADPFINEIVARELSWSLRNLEPGDPNILTILDIMKETGIQLR